MPYIRRDCTEADINQIQTVLNQVWAKHGKIFPMKKLDILVYDSPFGPIDFMDFVADDLRNDYLIHLLADEYNQVIFLFVRREAVFRIIQHWPRAIITIVNEPSNEKVPPEVSRDAARAMEVTLNLEFGDVVVDGEDN
ncbi:MAG: hypothetical protein MI864_07285 [Pseudomonadales bacterium]|uniref:Uncharacterized protein n=1 Tax=Oleiphilus messinensis TaxID=141451 RepID=A0A1Y0I2Y1_9GAMM|nr:hypothetical protein [Oleiphilus messinensis]ARU54569.1 hypothetical protein OLMES_0465 [Oleiphilus messinensis]MCG8610324.1 hypothetical protein [Pseudomonadales bacterium]